jgi:virginiamycin B lyase
VTPGGAVTEVAELTVAPGPLEGKLGEIAAGPDGNLWVTEPGSEEIARITPQGVVTQFSEGITGEPVSIAAGPNESLWFTERDGAVGQITTAAAPHGHPPLLGHRTHRPCGRRWMRHPS